MTAAFATPTTTWYLLLGAVLFSIGVVGVMVRRNPLVVAILRRQPNATTDDMAELKG